MSNETPYQIAPQVEALNAERENAVAYGNKTRVEQIDRQLADLGVKKKAAEERKASTEDEGTSRSKAPQGRSSKPKTETDQGT
jgi:hypothetical protein